MEVRMMEQRINNPVMVLPGAMEALNGLGKAIEAGGVPQETLELINMRASQINGCGVCLSISFHTAKQASNIDERLFVVAGWREAPYFTDAERAALALTEAVTRLNDRADPVPDAIWDEAARHYDEKALAALVLTIASINVWNRLNVATRQVAGCWLPS